MTERIKSPHVRISDADGIRFAILGMVTRALREGGASGDDIAEYIKAATTSNDYAHLLRTTIACVRTHSTPQSCGT